MWQHASTVLCKGGAFDEGSVEEPQTPCHLLFYLFAKTYVMQKITINRKINAANCTHKGLHTCKVHISWQVVPDTYNTSTKKELLTVSGKLW